MKNLFFTLIIAFTGFSLSAQTIINSLPLDKNVGIGTLNPVARLEINAGAGITPLRTLGSHGALLVDNVGSGESYYQADAFHQFQGASGAPILTMLNAGNVGIGTPAPEHKLTVVMDGGTNGTGVAIKAVNSGGPGSQPGLAFLNSSGNKRMYNYLDASSDTYNIGNAQSLALMTINQNGNVGIGTNSPDAKLAVNGTIHSREVKVNLQGWPDYVFKPDYVLPSLTEIKTYVTENHNLPEIPTEQEVAKDGIKLGELNKLLVKKIEELTLYLIQQKEDADKQNKILQQQIDELKKERSGH